MTNLVIDVPHLQTWEQRIGAMTVTVIGWLLWCYFFFPLLTLACWSLNYPECSPWVNLSGGYFKLRQMMTIYLETVAGIALAWLSWVSYDHFKRRPKPGLRPEQPVGREDLCRAFGVDADELKCCQESRLAVVHFDQQGHIVGLERIGFGPPSAKTTIPPTDGPATI